MNKYGIIQQNKSKVFKRLHSQNEHIQWVNAIIISTRLNSRHGA